MDDALAFDDAELDLVWHGTDEGVGTVDVQLLLSWYYETAEPDEVGSLNPKT